MTPEALALGLTQYVVLLFSLSVHESAHAWTALQQGDATAQSLGPDQPQPARPHRPDRDRGACRCCMIFTRGAAAGLGQAHAGRSARNFRSLRRGQIIVAGAGPVSNLLLALLFTAGALRGGPRAPGAAARSSRSSSC